MNKNLKFGEAVEALKEGKRVARTGWNGKGMFIFQRPGDVLSKTFLPNVKSLPDAVKKFLMDQNRDIEFTPYFCMYSASGDIVNGWLASQTDMQAED